MFPFAEQEKEALKYFTKTYSPFQKWFCEEDGKTWFIFAKGTSAFIERPQPEFAKIIDHWKAKLPMDHNYRELTR
jgi:hypothetical protein